VIDLFGLREGEARAYVPALYQWLHDRVKPERAQNSRASYREKWWVFAEPRSEFRIASASLSRFIATPMTAKHRLFAWISAGTVPDQGIVPICCDDSMILGVLSSEVHGVWALASGSRLGVGNDPRYNQSRCFDPFPFVGAADPRSNDIRSLADDLDAHRKRRQAAHPDLTLTGMYNVLEKLRSGEALTPKERTIHEQGLVSVLRQIHDDLDAAVLDAYGWSDLTPLLRIAHGNDAPAAGQTREEAKRAFDEAVLERLVALNAERAAEEARGIVRWLRPEFQNPAAKPDSPAPAQDDLIDAADDGQDAAATVAKPAKAAPWPKDPVAQVRAVADVLAASAVPLSTDDIASRFTARGPWKKRLPQLLEMLEAMGRARRTADTWSSGA